MRRYGLLMAAAVAIVANVFALAHAAWNRSEQLQTIELTSRELPVVWRSQDDSGVALRPDIGELLPQDLPHELQPYARPLFREPGVYATTPAIPGFAALEFNGKAYRTLQEKNGHLFSDLGLRYPGSTAPREESPSSRLVCVDASLRSRTLFDRYRGKSNYLIVRALLSFLVESKEKRPVVHVSVIPDSINVAAPWSQLPALRERIAAYPPDNKQRYKVKLAYGRSFEPWIVQITPASASH